MNDLIARLRAAYNKSADELHEEAADALEQLQRERDLAPRDASGAHERWNLACNDYADMKDRAEAAEAELAKRPSARLWDETSEALGKLRRLFAEREAELALVKGLLREVAQQFTRDDDLPNNLLSRIDAAMQGGSDEHQVLPKA